jgi:hypothetical protein
MTPDLKTFIHIAAAVIFVGLPVMLYALGDFPRRPAQKGGISLLALLACSLMLAQFFPARSIIGVIGLFDLRKVSACTRPSPGRCRPSSCCIRF